MKDSEIMESLIDVKNSVFFHRRKFSKAMIKWFMNHYRNMLIYIKYQEAEWPIADVMTAEEAELVERIKQLREDIGSSRHTETFTELAILDLQAIEHELIKVREEE
ncbi:MAG: hypothetical protein Q4B86_07360 [Eubacteriales bacterium]|nr:hypothetical protein [Eubacteriales bacterium]